MLLAKQIIWPPSPNVCLQNQTHAHGFAHPAGTLALPVACK
jgi:hypothetical protein